MDKLNKNSTISLMMIEAGENSRDHGFHEDWNDGSKIALIHSEVSEVLEELRKPDCKFNQNYFNPENPLKPEGVPAEIADVCIRIFDFCYHHNIDLGAAIVEKMEFNKSRPTRHGKKF